MALLPSHIRVMGQWLDLVSEVLVVDSESSDGTVDFLRENLRHPNVRYVPHPPGLYQSWNHGIAQTTGDFVYIATTGDSITREGIAHLLDVASDLEADVVLSAPRVMDEQERDVPFLHWPIHMILQELAIRETLLLNPITVLFYACHHGLFLGNEAILGSSASNLYRAAVMKKRPFPVDFGHSGDTAWGLINALDVRVCITPKIFTTFLVHGHTNARPLPVGAQQKWLAEVRRSIKANEQQLSSEANWRTLPWEIFLNDLGDLQRDHATLARLQFNRSARAFLRSIPLRARCRWRRNRIQFFKSNFLKLHQKCTADH